MDVSKKDGKIVVTLDNDELENLRYALSLLIETEHNAAEQVSDEAEYHYFVEALLEELKE